MFTVGKGTQGSVFKAYTKSSPKTAVAIKVISKNSLSRAGRDNLVTEIGILKKLKHKFIVDLVDFHWDDKYIYIVMEYCGAGSVSDIMRLRKKTLTEEEIATVLSDTLKVQFVQELIIIN